jgi:GWxTD domain-containing protein
MHRACKYIILSGISLFLITFCSAPRRTISGDENLYKKNNQELNIKFIAYHLNDSVSQIFFTIPNENLIYKRPDTSQSFYSILKVKFQLKEIRANKISDTGSVTIFDRQPEKITVRNINGSFSIKARLGFSYSANLTILDLNKKVKNVKVIEIDKESINSRQNFLLQTSSGQIIYNYYLHHRDTVLIRSLQNNQPALSVDHFRKEFPLSPPPYSLVERKAFQYKSDSTFITEKINSTFRIVIPQNGFYHIITDKDTKEGLTLFSVENAFPGIQNSTEMIRATRYIMSKKEYEDCLGAQDQKTAIDEFWKDLGGSNERAKELLKKYYNRVKEANTLFTSHQPGWQSDRGMIFIVFGAPDNMYKYANGEQWVYGNEAQPNSVRFNFKKMLNPFTDNDFALERNDYYKIHWYQAVDYWRQGHIYLDN